MVLKFLKFIPVRKDINQEEKRNDFNYFFSINKFVSCATNQGDGDYPSSSAGEVEDFLFLGPPTREMNQCRSDFNGIVPSRSFGRSRVRFIPVREDTPGKGCFFVSCATNQGNVKMKAFKAIFSPAINP